MHSLIEKATRNLGYLTDSYGSSHQTRELAKTLVEINATLARLYADLKEEHDRVSTLRAELGKAQETINALKLERRELRTQLELAKGNNQEDVTAAPAQYGIPPNMRAAVIDLLDNVAEALPAMSVLRSSAMRLSRQLEEAPEHPPKQPGFMDLDHEQQEAYRRVRKFWEVAEKTLSFQRAHLDPDTPYIVMEVPASTITDASTF